MASNKICGRFSHAHVVGQVKNLRGLYRAVVADFDWVGAIRSCLNYGCTCDCFFLLSLFLSFAASSVSLPVCYPAYPDGGVRGYLEGGCTRRPLTNSRKYPSVV